MAHPLPPLWSGGLPSQSRSIGAPCEPARRILAHLGLATDPPPLERARDPTDEVEYDEGPAQLALALELS